MTGIIKRGIWTQKCTQGRSQDRVKDICNKESRGDQKLGEKDGEDSLSQLSERKSPEFKLLTSRTMRQYISVVKPPIGGPWLQQPQETHALNENYLGISVFSSAQKEGEQCRLASFGVC